MYTTNDLQAEILRLKKEKDICILAHAYQNQDILEVADYIGDSYGLSVEAAKVPNQTVLMCGVRFMAETVKILSPEKRVLVSHKEAGCPMAEQLTPAELMQLKQEYPDYTVVAYVNTTAELKTLCDVCVTSASAVKVVKSIPNQNILFIPDCNLGAWVAEQCPEKNFKFIKGGCPIHLSITEQDVDKARKLHPDAQLLAHPECHSSVSSKADFLGSTTEIMAYVRNSSCDSFIIGTENSIVQHLQYEMPEKNFYALSKSCICHDMKLTTLIDVLHCLQGTGGDEIRLSDDVIKKARRSIDNMLNC